MAYIGVDKYGRKATGLSFDNRIQEKGEDRIGKYLGGKGLERRSQYKGVTSDHRKINKSGKGWTEGIGNLPGMGELQGTGWISGDATLGQGSELKTVNNPEGDVYWNQAKFRKNYYDPYVKEAMGDPVNTLGGLQYGGGGQIKEGSNFSQVNYLDPNNNQTVTGYMAHEEGGDLQGDIESLSDTMKAATKDFEAISDTLKWEEGGEVYDKAKEALDTVELDARRSRDALQGNKPEAYEQARAQQARSGMSYSAPASQAETNVTTKVAETSEDVSQNVINAKKAFEGEKEKSLDDLEIAEGLYDDSKKEYYTGMKGFGGQQLGMSGELNKIDNILQLLSGAHAGMGKVAADLGQKASVKDKHAMTQAGMFKDDVNTPVVQAYREWMYSSDASSPQSFSRNMQAAMSTARSNVGDNS